MSKSMKTILVLARRVFTADFMIRSLSRLHKNYLKMIGITFTITADNYVKASRNVLSKFINS